MLLRNLDGTPEKRAMNADEHRLLKLLAASEDGCSEAVLMAHGFGLELLDGVVIVGLATAKAEHTIAAGRAVKSTRMRITEAGRQVLADRGR
jgi:hypothetical protein